MTKRGKHIIQNLSSQISDLKNELQEVKSSGKPKRYYDTIKYQVTLYRIKQDIAKWRQATLYAENIVYPNRTEYYRMGKDIALDAHYTSVVNQIKNSVLSRKYFLKNPDGTNNVEKTKLLKSSWFIKMLSLAMDADDYGFTLLDLGPCENFRFPDLKIVPREYVKPELNCVANTTAGTTGVALDDPAYQKWNIFIGEVRDLGRLLKVAPLVIWKKGVTGYWSEYCEKFGMPLRVGKTNIRDEELKANMENALKNMGSSFWGLLNKDDSIDLLSSDSKSAWEVYDKMIERMNSEISKLILSQTGTTDEKSFAGSASVHADVMSEITERKCMEMEYLVNEKFLPVFNMHDFGFENLTFEFDYSEELSKKDKAAIDASFMPYVKFDKQYLEETYGIKLSDEDIDTEAEGNGEKKKSITNYQNIIDLYNSVCPHCSGFGYENKKDDDIFTEDDKNSFIDNIYNGAVTPFILPVDYYHKVANAFEASIEKGFGEFDIQLGLEDQALLGELRTNVYAFSAAKTYRQVKEMSVLLAKYKNNYSAFKAAAGVIFDDFNKNWLQTERDTAVNSAYSARNWVDNIERRKSSVPFLEYHTVGDSRVRPTHAALDGITRKVDDKFWSDYYPPNGWRCRCTTLSHSDVAQVTDMSNFKKPNDVPDIFMMNAGKDRLIFSPKHPYFKVNKNVRGVAMQNFGLPLP